MPGPTITNERVHSPTMRAKRDMEGTWGDIKDKVSDTVYNLRHKGEKVLNELGEKVRDTSAEVEKESRIHGRRVEGVDRVGTGRSRIHEGKLRFQQLFDRNQGTLRNLAYMLIPLILLCTAIIIGVSAYRYSTRPLPLSTWDGVKERAHLYGDQAFDLLHSSVDYAHEKANLLGDNIAHLGEKAKDSLWEAKDKAAIEANQAYVEALRKARDAKRNAELRSREAISEVRKYIKHETKPASMWDRMWYPVTSTWNWIGSKTGLAAEDLVHKANLAKEEARHQAYKAKLHGEGSSIGTKIKEGIHDVKENIKEKIHKNV